jgi:hypothetical protein
MHESVGKVDACRLLYAGGTGKYHRDDCCSDRVGVVPVFPGKRPTTAIHPATSSDRSHFLDSRVVPIASAQGTVG